jgi:Flp pilus assembly protein TadD
VPRFWRSDGLGVAPRGALRPDAGRAAHGRVMSARADGRRIGLILALLSGLMSGCASHPRGQIGPEQRLNIARAAEASGNLGLAHAMYAATADVARDKNLRLRAADGLERIGDPGAAIAILDSILAQYPNDMATRQRLGSAQVRAGQAGEGAANLRIVLAARPSDDVARLDLAVAFDLLGRHGQAQPLYRMILSRSPGDMDAANDLALSLMMSGQREAAHAVLAPFLGRRDMPARMKATVKLVEGDGSNTAPTRLYPEPR